jgi:hypothetical protein
MAELSIVSDASTSQISLAKATATPGSKIPAGDTLIYKLRGRWDHARTRETKRAVIFDVIGAIKLARVRVKAKYDSEGRSHNLPAEAALAVGREALATSAREVAMHYGYTVGHAYELADRARRHDTRAKADRDRDLYDGTLEMRVRIAAASGTVRAVGEEFGVSDTSVCRWRSLHSTESGQSA